MAQKALGLSRGKNGSPAGRSSVLWALLPLYGRFNGASSDAPPYDSGRAGPSGANVVGCRMRSLSISRIHAGECQVESSLSVNDLFFWRAGPDCSRGESAFRFLLVVREDSPARYSHCRLFEVVRRPLRSAGTPPSGVNVVGRHMRRLRTPKRERWGVSEGLIRCALPRIPSSRVSITQRGATRE